MWELRKFKLLLPCVLALHLQFSLFFIHFISKPSPEFCRNSLEDDKHNHNNGQRMATSAKVFELVWKETDILQLNDLAGQRLGEISSWMSVSVARLLLEKLHQYVETISRKGRVELSYSTNDYAAECYMHVKVSWEQNKCALEAMLAGYKS